jgi:hypothetical protein
MLQVIPGHVLAVLGEFHRKAVIRALVHAREIALDDETGLQIEAAHLGQGEWVKVSLGILFNAWRHYGGS